MRAVDPCRVHHLQRAPLEVEHRGVLCVVVKPVTNVRCADDGVAGHKQATARCLWLSVERDRLRRPVGGFPEPCSWAIGPINMPPVVPERFKPKEE
eukprot:scaffold20882_cov71-Phaeocystis_antarctica.AAC.13